MDTALPQKFPFILDSNLAKANCTGNHVCTSCDIVVLDWHINSAPQVHFSSSYDNKSCASGAQVRRNEVECLPSGVLLYSAHT